MTIRMRVLPRFPARISGRDGFIVVRENTDLVVGPDYGSLITTPVLTDLEKKFFQVFDSSDGSYIGISAKNLADEIQGILVDGTLAAIGALTPAANQGIFFLEGGVASVFTITQAGRDLVAGPNAATQRTTLGLGTLAVKSSVNNDDWSGTDLSIANGGTGASTAPAARTALGLGTMATQDASAVAITGGSFSGGAVTGSTVWGSIITNMLQDIAVVDGGTGASDAAGARANLGVPSLAQAVPAGGSSGQVLAKNSAANNDVSWQTIPGSLPLGGNRAQVLIKNTNTSGDVKWASAAFVNVADNGVEPNTSSDKTAAIQALQDAFGTNGGVLYFPPGSYPVSSLKLKNKVNGFNGTMLMGAGQGTQLVPFGQPDHLLRVEGARCAVKDISLNASGVALRAAETATLWDGQPTLFDNVAFLSATEHGLRNWDGDALFIHNCYFLSNAQWSIYSRNNMMNSSISSNFMQGGGIALASATQQCEGLRINDNTILNTQGVGIDVVNGLEIQIFNNIIDQGVDSDIVVRNNTSYVKIIGNWLAGIKAQPSASVKLRDDANNIHIKNNTFEGGSEAQILLQSASLGRLNRLMITGNTMRNMATGFTNIYATGVTRTMINENIIDHSGAGDTIFFSGGGTTPVTSMIRDNILSKAPNVDASASLSGNIGV